MRMEQMSHKIQLWPQIWYMDGILPKGPYLPCVRMAGRTLLAGYHRYMGEEHCPTRLWVYLHYKANYLGVWWFPVWQALRQRIQSYNLQILKHVKLQQMHFTISTNWFKEYKNVKFSKRIYWIKHYTREIIKGIFTWKISWKQITFPVKKVHTDGLCKW